MHALMQELLIQFATWQDQGPLIQQTVYSSLYVYDKANYADNPVLKAFIEGMLYVVYVFYRCSLRTFVLREDEISFPPNHDQYSNESHPVLRDTPVTQIHANLKQAQETGPAEFSPYLKLLDALVLSTAWTLEPASI